MRGEQTPTVVTIPWQAGSSPHARGAAREHDVGVFPPRIIPACAGSRNTGTNPTRSAGDHPRMRGEQENGTVDLRTGEGSSPHARGAVPGIGFQRDDAGIIPACAGSSGSMDRRS